MSHENVLKLKEVVEEIRESMPLQIELMSYRAKLIREYYDALIQQEFTPQQALELCKDFRV